MCALSVIPLDVHIPEESDAMPPVSDDVYVIKKDVNTMNSRELIDCWVNGIRLYIQKSYSLILAISNGIRVATQEKLRIASLFEEMQTFIDETATLYTECKEEVDRIFQPNGGRSAFLRYTGTGGKLAMEKAEIVSTMGDRALTMRYASLGLSYDALNRILNERRNDLCGLCHGTVTYDYDDVAIIVPCCGKRLHKRCFDQWTNLRDTCMFCRRFCRVSMKGFATHVCYIEWEIWCDKMRIRIQSNPKDAICDLVMELNNDREDTRKDYAAMQLFDLTVVRTEDESDELDKCYMHVKGMLHHGVSSRLLALLFDRTCEEDAKEAAAILYRRLIDIFAIENTDPESNQQLWATFDLDESRMKTLVAKSVFDRQAYRDMCKIRIARERRVILAGID